MGIYDALIVGFGPVGAAMANLLARRGLRVGVLEAERQLYDKPRAITLDHEVMRIFQTCGLAHRIAEFTAPHPGTDYLGVDGRLIKRFDPLPPPYPLGWPPTGSFVQPEVEARLREGVTDSANVDVFLGHAATHFTQDNEGVTLALREVARDGTVHDAERIVKSRYLLGCDGANSFVRKALRIPLEDLEFEEWWLVVDVRIVRPVSLPEKCIQYCSPSRPATFVTGPGNLRRWEFKMLPGERPEEFGRRESVMEQLARFVDPSCVKVARSAVYRFHALLAERWRERRVFLLGDACHQTPPFLGQGLCAGIRDAANLSWKLAMVLQNGAPTDLLDSYELERKPHVRALVATAKEFGQIIGELDPVAARMRDEALRGRLERGEAETIRQRYIPDLAAGIIDRANRARGAGTLFVQPQIESSPGGPQLLDDLLSFRFLIATATAEAQEWLTPEACEIWRRIGGERVVICPRGQASGAAPSGSRQVAEQDGLFATWMRAHGCAAAIIRPDRYVFGLARDPGELNRLVASVGDSTLGPSARATAFQ